MRQPTFLGGAKSSHTYVPSIGPTVHHVWPRSRTPIRDLIDDKEGLAAQILESYESIPSKVEDSRYRSGQTT